MAPSVEIAGSGPDLVLLHGWGLSSSVWQPVRERLAAHYTLHLVDLPGHGRSRSVSLASLAGLVAAIARLVPAKAMLCGWSLGGLVAQSIAATQPVRRLVLVSSTPSFLARDGWPDGMQPGTLADFAGDLARDWRVTLARFLQAQRPGREPQPGSAPLAHRRSRRARRPGARGAGPRPRFAARHRPARQGRGNRRADAGHPRHSRHAGARGRRPLVGGSPAFGETGRVRRRRAPALPHPCRCLRRCPHRPRTRLSRPRRTRRRCAARLRARRSATTSPRSCSAKWPDACSNTSSRS